MNPIMMLIPVVLALLGGAILFGVSMSWKKQKIYIMSLTLMISILVWSLILLPPEKKLVIFQLTGNLDIELALDKAGCVFAGLISFLWPLADMYAFEYMKDEPRKGPFFGFYIMTYGATLGVALAGNIITLYFFYEMLTLVSVYLVMHPLTKEAIKASRIYLYYSLGGAAFAFLSIVCIGFYGDTTGFVLGGVLDPTKIAGHESFILLMFLFAFCGFGVKAAIFPFHGWLPRATVAPTPVTALLHAVAVVKSGAFAIIRMIYYIYGADYLRGTWAQYAVMSIAMITILFGSTMAVKEIHFKRRLAYSTISNLSYVLLGASMMTPLGLTAAFAHLIFHAIMKICGFFCAGAVLHETGREYVKDLEGMGRKMPVIFACFTIVGISLAGIPPMAGFASKWSIASAAVNLGVPLSYGAVAVLLYSAFMTAIYMGTIIIKAWFPGSSAKPTGQDPNWLMKGPILIFAVLIVVAGLFSRPILALLAQVAGQ